MARWFLLLGVVVGWWLPAAAAAAAPVPRYEAVACSFDVPADVAEDVECGRLIVHEDRTRPSGRTLGLAVTRIHGRGPDVQPDPVVYLSGGPGSSGVDNLEQWLSHPLRADREMILFGQRGTRHSESLCPDLVRHGFEIVAADRDAQADIEEHRLAARGCLDELRARGVDPTQYRSSVSAADLEDLRHVLGYEQWNLLGVSYGTRLALTVLRDSPESVRSVVLGWPHGPQHDFYRDFSLNQVEALDQLGRDCAETPSCREVVPDLAEAMGQLLDDVERDPLVVEMGDTSLSPSGVFVLNRQDLVWLFGDFLSAEALRPLVPAAVVALRRRQTDFLPTLLAILVEGYADLDLGMYYAVQCQEEVPFAAVGRDPRADGVTRIGVVGAIGEVCRDWSLGTPEPRENEPVVSAVPTLVLVGEHDFRAPPRNGRDVARHLAQSQLVEIPGGGHGGVDDPCVSELMVSFVDHPADAIETACLSGRTARPPLGAVHVRGGVLRTLMELKQPRPWSLLAVVPLLVLGMFFVGAPVAWLWRWLRRRRSRQHEAVPRRRSQLIAAGAAWCAAGCAWGFCLGLAMAVMRTLSEGAGILVLGLPQDAGVLFILPKALAVLVVVGLGGIAIGWRQGRWPLHQRLSVLLALAAGAAFVAFALHQGLF